MVCCVEPQTAPADAECCTEPQPAPADAECMYGEGCQWCSGQSLATAAAAGGAMQMLKPCALCPLCMLPSRHALFPKPTHPLCCCRSLAALRTGTKWACLQFMSYVITRTNRANKQTKTHPPALLLRKVTPWKLPELPSTSATAPPPCCALLPTKSQS